MTPRIIIGISGASGFQYGVKALELLRPLAIEVHLVVSKGAEKTCELETDYRLDEVMALADVVHPINHLGASISSGSFKTLGCWLPPARCDHWALSPTVSPIICLPARRT